MLEAFQGESDHDRRHNVLANAEVWVLPTRVIGLEVACAIVFQAWSCSTGSRSAEPTKNHGTSCASTFRTCPRLRGFSKMPGKIRWRVCLAGCLPRTANKLNLADESVIITTSVRQPSLLGHR